MAEDIRTNSSFKILLYKLNKHFKPIYTYILKNKMSRDDEFRIIQI